MAFHLRRVYYEHLTEINLKKKSALWKFCSSRIIIDIDIPDASKTLLPTLISDMVYKRNVVQHVGKITNCVKHNKVEADTLNAETTMK